MARCQDRSYDRIGAAADARSRKSWQSERPAHIFQYGDGSETIGAFVHCRCPAAAQLMSATSSPGRTWPIFIAER